MASFNLSALAVREKAITLFLILGLFGAGIFSFINLGRGEDPLFTIKVLTVAVVWPGAKAQEMQDLVAEPLEKRLQELQYYDRVETFTTPGQAFLMLTLKDSIPKDQVEPQFYQARKKLGDEAHKLPQGVIGPFINDEYADVSFALYSVKSKGMPLRKLVRQAEIIRQRLLHVPGVKKINIEGERPERIFVEFSYARLANLGVSARDIFSALEKQNVVTPAGSVETFGNQILVRLDGAFDDLEKIRRTPVVSNNKTFSLEKIAEVKRGYEDPPKYYIRHNGEEALLLNVFMQDAFNGLELGESLEKMHKEIAAELPFGVSLERVTDQAVNIREAVGEFMLKFAVALSVVMFVSLLSMGWRVGIVVAAAIPLTLSSVFLIMLSSGRFFDRITLGALILGLGLLVDDAIIAIEIMVVKMEEGWDRIRAASYAWSHTAAPMLSGTLVTIISLMPVAFGHSAANEYAGNIFWIVAFSLLASWIVAVVFTPYLGVSLLPNIKAPEGGPESIYTTPGYNAFRAMVKLCIKGKYVVACIVVGCFAAAIVGMGVVKKQFFPISDRPEVLVEVIAPQGASIKLTDRAVAKIENWLKTRKEAEVVTSYLGGGAARFFISYNPELPNPNFAKIVILTKNAEARDRLKHALRAAVANGLAPEARVRVLQLVFGPFTPWPVTFRIMGPDLHTLRLLANQAEDIVRKNPHVRMVNQDWGDPSRTIHFVLDQDRLNLIGLTTNEASEQLQFLLTGYSVTQVREDIRTIDIVARALPKDRLDPARINSLNLTSKSGALVPLTQVGRIEIRPENYILKRRDRTPVISINCDVAEDSQPPDVSAEVRKSLEAFVRNLPAGYRLEVGGDTEEAAKANVAVASVFPLMILLMFTVVIFQVRRFSAMFMVMLTGPLGLCGVVPILILFNQPFGFNAIIGTSALAGILMRNTLILIDQIHINEEHGLDQFHAVVEATVQRSRPVILTALAAVLAFIPLTQSVFWGSMAFTLIGGTAIGTALTLLFLPALFAIWFKVKETNVPAQSPPAKPVIASLVALLILSCNSAQAVASMDDKGDSSRIDDALQATGSPVLQPRQPVEGIEPGRGMPELPERSKSITSKLDATLAGSDELLHARELPTRTPALKALISIRHDLSPLTLESKSVQPVDLKETLELALERNLDLAITRNLAERDCFLHKASRGYFLPDFQTNFTQSWLYGQLGLPYTKNQLFGSNTAGGNSALYTLAFPYSLDITGVRYWLYRGGRIVYGAKQAKHEMQASRARNFANYSDVLKDTSTLYYKLLLAEAILQIRIRAVETSEEQTRFNSEKLQQGLATNLEYLQARTQLSEDRQALIEQQVNRRLAALDLTAYMNYDQSADIRTAKAFVSSARLVSERASIDDLIKMAIENRPELKQYGELLQASKAAIKVASAALKPTVSTGAYVVPTGRTGSNIESLFVASINVNWSLDGLGSVDYNRIRAAKINAKNADLEVDKQVIAVTKEVRASYLKSASSAQVVKETLAQVDSSVEELRSARTRYELGLGTHLDVLTAQRDLTQAQINLATATINYNISQVDLVRSLGLCSVKNLTEAKSLEVN